MQKRKPTPHKEQHKFNRSALCRLVSRLLGNHARGEILTRVRQYREEAAPDAQSQEEAELMALADHYSMHKEHFNKRMPCQKWIETLVNTLHRIR